MTLTLSRLGGLLLLALSLARPSQAHASQRHYRPVEWDSIGAIESSATTTLYNPLSLVAYGDSIAVVDYGDQRLKCFARDGTLLGAFGHRGHGPWEVSGLTGVTLGSDGHLWVGDRGNIRAYALDHRCQPLAQVSLASSPQRVFGLPSGDLLLIGALDSAPAIIDTLRRRKPIILSVIPALKDVDPLVRTALDLTTLPTGGFAVAYLYGPWLAVYSPLTSLTPVRTPESQDFPAVTRWRVGPNVARVGPDPNARRLANSIATDGRRLFVLSPGFPVDDKAYAEAADFGNTVDIYSLPNGRYVESWRLPRPAWSLAWGGSYLVLLSREPEPAVTYWRLK